MAMISPDHRWWVCRTAQASSPPKEDAVNNAHKERDKSCIGDENPEEEVQAGRFHANERDKRKA